jgi:hypothetical protein
VESDPEELLQALPKRRRTFAMRSSGAAGRSGTLHAPSHSTGSNAAGRIVCALAEVSLMR